MERKLASIQRIDSVEEIQGADYIEKATVLGWHLVVQKNEFKPNDKCIYIEIDSLLPDIPQFDFLKYPKGKVPEEGFVHRLKTKKLKGVVSQGLAMPLSAFATTIPADVKVGGDVTDYIGIKKYEPPVQGKLKVGQAKSTFPNFIPKTDEIRVQSIPWVVDAFRSVMVYVTVKLDGCLHYKCRVYTDRGEIPIGRIVNQKLPVKVMTFSEKTGKIEYKEIIEYHKYERKDPFLCVGVQSRGVRGKGSKIKNVICTPNHRFYSNGTWVRADELKVGDKISHLFENISIEIKQLILGSLLGDSSISGTVTNRTFSFSHSIAQTEYFEYKKKILGPLFRETKGSVGGFPGSKQNRRGYSLVNRCIHDLISEFCEKDGKKSLTQKWISNLTPVALAFWYQDDGSLQHRDESVQKPRASFATNKFSYDECEMLKAMLKLKFNIDCSIYDDGGKGYKLTLSSDGTKILAMLISPYVTKSMRYKLPKEYENDTCIFDVRSFNLSLGLFDVDVLSITSTIPSGQTAYSKYQYDLTVKENSNYFAHFLLTHNTSATYYVKDGQFGVCSRNQEWKRPVPEPKWRSCLVKLAFRFGALRVLRKYGYLRAWQAGARNTYWEVSDTYGIESLMRGLVGNYAIQGEICGPGIKKNRMGLKEVQFFVFDVYDIDKRQYLNYHDQRVFIDRLGKGQLRRVPEVGTFEFPWKTVDEVLRAAEGKYDNGYPREGIVIRTIGETTWLELGRGSFKAISNKYLLSDENFS